MKKRIWILMFLLLMPLGVVNALTNDDPHKNVTCLYKGKDGYTANLQIVGMNPDNSMLAGVYSLNIEKNKTSVYNKIDIANYNIPIADEKFTLETHITNNVEKADKGNSAAMVCPQYLIYYEYYFQGKDKKNQLVFVSDKESRISSYTNFVNSDTSGMWWWKKSVDTSKTKTNILNYYEGSAIYGTDADEKKLDTANKMEQNQSQQEELKQKLEENPDDAQTKEELEKLEEEQQVLNDQAEIYTQATIDQGTQNSEASKEATKKIHKIRKENNLLNITVTITSGCAVISDDLGDWLIQLLDIIKIAALVLTLVLGMFDFLKGTVSGEADAMKKVWKSFSRRLIAVVLLFLLPVIIEFILGLVSIYGVDVDNPLCLKDI